MSEKKEKKSRKTKKVENGLNTVNNEKLNTKKETKIKEDVLDIEFDTYKIQAGDSEYITKVFGNSSNFLKDEVLDFFYNEKLGSNMDNRRLGNSVFGQNIYPDLQDINAHNIFIYQLNCYKKLEEALGIPKILLGFRQNITYLDKVYDKDTVITLPRYQKMLRLQILYDRLVKIGLQLIHSYYWEDITQNKKSIDLSIKDSIKKASPYILKLKKDYEDTVRKEYEYDTDEEKLFMITKKY